MTFTSYAQNHEDVILWRALKHIRVGFYVDVGANDPLEDSVTQLFYEHGWHGINIEPSPTYFKRLQEARSRDTNLAYVVGDTDGTVTFYEATTRGLSTATKDVGEQYRVNGKATLREAQQLRLDTILERHGNECIHFLKIDVEGAEAAVIAGLSLDKFRPWVLVVESLDPITQKPSFESWERKIITGGYSLVFFDGLNRYYVAKEHEELAPAFSAPPNVLDGFVPWAQMRQIQRVIDSKKTCAEAEARAQEAEASMLQLDELNRGLHRWQSIAGGLDQELKGVYASKSWRITLPLRKLSGWTFGRNNIARRMLRGVLLRILAGVRNAPVSKTPLRRVAAYFPKIGLHMYAFAKAHPPESAKRSAGAFVQKMPQSLARLSCSHSDGVGQECQYPLPRGQRIIYYYVDHTVGCLGNTGVQRVVRGLARAWQESGERLYFVKWNSSHRQLVLATRDEVEHLAQWGGPELNHTALACYPVADAPDMAIAVHKKGEANWLVVPEVLYLGRDRSAVTLDVIMAAKRSGLKSAFVFYDATPLRREELANMAPGHEEYMQQVLLADLVVPISEWSASELMIFFAHHEMATSRTWPQIETLPLTGESRRSPRATAEAQIVRKRILAVGSITPHKNQLTLVKAFEEWFFRYPESDWELVLVGSIHPDLFPELASSTARVPSIKVLNYLSDEEVDRLLRECAFTVFPSLMEGCGLPILESLWYGKPCVCANFGAMAEVAAGGGCLMVDVRSKESILAALHQLIFEPGRLSRLCAEALARPLLSWEDYASSFGRLLDQHSDPLNKIGVIYYWIDHTVQFPGNTGIQRVARQLARALMELGARVVPVRWDRSEGRFANASGDDLTYFGRWNGPSPEMWTRWQDPSEAESGSWLIVPELIHYLGQEGMSQLQSYARSLGLKTAWIYHDALPITLAHLYDPGVPAAHREYMLGLRYSDVILANSVYSAKELKGFLSSFADRVLNIDTKVQSCALPGEFLEATQVTEPSDERSSVVRILCVGTAEPRKNHAKLLLACDLVRQRSGQKFELLLVGRPCTQEVNDLILKYTQQHLNVRWEQKVTDAQLREFYNQCDFTVFPSLAEGFGLPVLESLWHARPCICGSVGALGEVASGGGCLVVDTTDIEALAGAMISLIEDTALRRRLAIEATRRTFKTWREYGREVVGHLAKVGSNGQQRKECLSTRTPSEMYSEFVNLQSRPLLSICISTYNRAAWLGLSLKNIARLIPEPLADIEIVVCDNASTDSTPEAVKPYMWRRDFRYYRNAHNVGMLGNLRITAHYARGRHVWILGDDDLIMPRSLEKILSVLRGHPNLPLVYLNYAYTHESDPNTVMCLERFFTTSTPIVAPGPDISGPIRHICTASENFFTAIYCLIFRRDHALKAYSQNTDGRPFSTMLTCIPTTYYVLKHMMDEVGYWIGEPQVVVNMNVSWLQYASLWILERLPEVFDLSEAEGASQAAVDVWRARHVGNIEHWFREIMDSDECGNGKYFSPARLVMRFKHLKEFKNIIPRLMEIYEAAYLRGAECANVPTAEIFPQS